METRDCVQEHYVAAHGATVLSTQFSVSMELWKSFRNKENSVGNSAKFSVVMTADRRVVGALCGASWGNV
jgi:hypothetical protein